MKSRESGFGLIMIIMMLASLGSAAYFGAEPAMDKYNEIMGKVRDGRRMHELRNVHTLLMTELALKGKSPAAKEINEFLKSNSPKKWADASN